MDRSNLRAETQGNVWTLTAEDLLLQQDCLDSLGVPFAIRSGSVKKLTVVWSETGPAATIQILVDTVFVVLQSTDARHLSAEQVNAAEQQAKRALLENWEAQLDSSFASAAAANDGGAPQSPLHGDTEGKNSSLLSALLGKLEVSISAVTICYFDAASNHTLGVSIEALGFSNSPPESGAFAEHSSKEIRMQGLSLYLDKTVAPQSPEEAFMQIHSYLLHPASVSLTVGYDSQRAKRDLTRPKIAVKAAISSIALQMHRRQFLALANLIDDMGKRVACAPPRTGRPVQRPTEDARAWWGYARDLVIEDLRQRKQRRSASYLMERRKTRRRYIELYVKLRADSLSRREATEMEAIQDKFAFQDLVFFRCSALKRLQDEQQKVVQRRKTSLYARVVGSLSWASRASAPDPAEASEEQEDASPLMALSLEEREALLTAMDAAAHTQSHNYLFHSHSAEQCMYSASLTCGEVSARLVDEGLALDTSATLSLATVTVDGKAEELALNASMNELVVSDLVSGSVLCRQTGPCKTSDEMTVVMAEQGAEAVGQLLAMAIHRSWGRETQTRVRVRVAALGLMFDLVILQALAGFWQIPNPSIDLHAAARYARKTYSGLRQPVSTIEDDSTLRAGNGETGTFSADHRAKIHHEGKDTGERVMLDMSIAAPTIYLQENVLDNRKTVSVLVVRLGHLSIQDMDDDHYAGLPGGTRTRSHNQYSLEVARVGIDLMHDVKIPVGVDHEKDQEGRRTKIIDDTRLRARVTLELSGRHDSNASSISGPRWPQRVEVEAELKAFTVDMSAADLCDIVHIAASWAPSQSLGSSRPSEASSILMAGWLLVKGGGVSDSWCWRWLQLHSSGLMCFKTEESSALPEHTFPLDIAPIVPATVKGVRVLVLRLEGSDDCVSVRKARCDDENTNQSGGLLGETWHQLMIYPGIYFTQWHNSIRNEQIHINPLLDGEVTFVARPQVILMEPSGQLHAKDPSSFSLKIKATSLIMTLRSDDGCTLLDCRLHQVSSSVVSKVVKEWSLLIAGISVHSAARDGGRGLQSVLSQREQGFQDAQFFKAEMSFEATSRPHVHVCMQAMDVCLDNSFVNQVLSVYLRASRAWNDSKSWSKGLGIDSKGGSAEEVYGHCPFSPPFMSSGIQKLMLSPRNEALRKVGRYCSLMRSQVPNELLSETGPEAQHLVLQLSFETQGMSLEFEDEKGTRILRIEMSRVDLLKQNFADNSSKITGSLGGLHILDTFAQNSLHNRVLTVSKNTDKIVRLELFLFDIYSISYPGYDKFLSLSIIRPEITVLFRLFDQFSQYSALFCVSREDKNANAALADSAVEGRSNKQARDSTRLKIVLEHPCLILPRNSLSNERIVADLGMIDLQNVLDSEQNDSEEQVQKWQIRFTKMKLETLSENGNSSVITHNVDGFATISSIKQATMTSLCVDVSLGEMTGVLTDAQYALLSAALSQNLSERYINPSIESSVNGAPLSSMGESEGANQTTFQQLSEQVQQALSRMDFKRITMKTVVKISKVDVAIFSSGDSGLDAPSSTFTPFLQAVGTCLVARFVVVEKMAPEVVDPDIAGCEELLWQLKASFFTLEVKDRRPAMAQRALPFISTQKKDKEACFLLVVSKTSSGNTCLEVDFRRVGIVADAGLMFRFLSWLEKSGQRAQQSAVRHSKGFHFTLARQSGLAVRSTLSDACIHLVTSFEEAEADSVLVEGTVVVCYAQVFQNFQLTCSVGNMTVASQRKTQSKIQIVQQCSVQYKLLWSESANGIPTSMRLDSPGCDAVLSHENVSMLSVVLSTLSASLRTRDQGDLGQTGQCPQNPAPGVLEFQVSVGMLSCAFTAASETQPWTQVQVGRICFDGTRMLDNCYRVSGSLGTIEIMDESVAHSQHPKILTGSDSINPMMSFEITSCDSSSILFPGQRLAMKISISNPRITLVWRFVTYVTSYIASFKSFAVEHDKKGTATECASRSGDSDSSALLTDRQLDSSPQDTKLEPRTDQQVTGVLIEIELNHPYLIIPRNSHVKEAFVADLGKMVVRNSVEPEAMEGVQGGWQISLHSMRLDSCSTTGTMSKVVDEIDSVVRLNFQKRESIAACKLLPTLNVDISLPEVRGCVSDAQYGLLLSVFGQNFSEQRTTSDTSQTQSLGQSMPTIPAMSSDNNVLGNLAELLRSAQAASASCGLNAVYNAKVGVVELLLGTAEDLNANQVIPLMLATGKGFVVRYEMLEFAGDRDCSSDIEDIDTCGQERIVMGCRWTCESLTMHDRSSLQPRAKPFISVTSKVEVTPTTVETVTGNQGPSLRNLIFSQDIGHDTGAFVLRMFKTFSSHSFIELEFREVEAVADAGLLMTLLGWIGRGGEISSANVKDRENEFQCKISQPGALLVRTTLPSATINLVTSFQESEPDRVVLGGLVDVHYGTISGSQNALSVDIKDFCLTSCSRIREASDFPKEIVTPCVFTYTQVWCPVVGSSFDTREPQIVVCAKDFNAMITYEDVLLGLRIAANIKSNLSTDAGQRKQTSPDHGENSPDGQRVAGSGSSETVLTPPADPENRSREPVEQFPRLKREQTKLLSESTAHDSNEDETTGKQIYRINVSGDKMRLTLVDDYNGRWIPLVRALATDPIVAGTSRDLQSTLLLAIDFFHQPSCKWKAALDPWDVELRCTLDDGNTYIGVEDGSLSQDTQKHCMFHLSGAAIESFRFAVSSWTQDRRARAILNAHESHEGADDTLVMSGSSGTKRFVPYVIRNLLAEALICILQDGEEHSIDPQGNLELTYQQVWRRRGALHYPQAFDPDGALGNEVCLQLAGSPQVFCKVSLEIEQATSYVIEAADLKGDGPPFPVHIVCDLTRSHGQKSLSVSSMVTIMNGSNTSFVSGVRAPDQSVHKIGLIPPNGALAVPLHLSRDGTLLIQPVVTDLDYQWCGETTEGIALRSIHDGSVRTSQAVDMKFQSLFGGSFPADVTLLSSYSCANDVDGVLWQGMLYVSDFALCHYSNLIGGEMKVAIKLVDIVSLRKVNTALVFPNAIEIKTHTKTYCFRTLRNRAEAFRCILKALPDKKLAVRNDDVDDRANHVFNLEQGDVILALHTGMLHDGDHFVHDPTGLMDGDNGYILLSTHHLLFMTTDFVGKLKVRWANVEALEKKTRNMVRNNAVLVQARHGMRVQSVLLSSSKWNRDNVFDDHMMPLWKAASAAEGNVTTGSFSDSSQHYTVSTRCRTLTCNIVRAHATPVQNDPGDKNAVYSRQKMRARDSITWTAVLVDAVTKKIGSDRTVGNPCIVRLHAPWVVENLSSADLEVQLIDQTRSCIVNTKIAAGDSNHVLGVDLRREVFLRVRVPFVKERQTAWSEGFLIHTDSGKNELEGLLELQDTDSQKQPLVVEVSRDLETCGFRVTLYNRYWMLNLTGLELKLRKSPVSSYEAEIASSLTMPIGKTIGYDVVAGHDLEVRALGFQWSAPFGVDRESVEGTALKFTATDVQQGRGRLETRATSSHQVIINVSSSTAAGKFDRTVIVTFAPEVMVENCLAEPVVIWQRTTDDVPYDRSQRPTLWLDPGHALPFFPEGGRARCQLSVNTASEDIRGQCVAFAPESADRLLLKTSDDKIFLASTHRHSAKTGTLVVRFDEMNPSSIPHKIRNHSGLALAFRQKDSDTSVLVRVRPHETVNVVWPEPRLKKILQLAEIESCPLTTSNVTTLAMDMDRVQRGATPLYDGFAARNLKALMEQWRLREVQQNGVTYVLRLANPQDERLGGCSASAALVELREFGKYVLGRDPVAEGADECLCKLDTAPHAGSLDCDWHALISRRHIRLELDEKGGWVLKDLSSTNGVFVNGQPVESCVLCDGDVIRLGGTSTADGNVESPFVYVFEKKSALLQRRAEEACLLHASVELDGGSKVMHLTPSPARSNVRSGTGSTKVTLSSKSICLMIQDDDASETDELLFLQLDGVKAAVLTDAQSRQLAAKVDRLQLDNQFDPLTPFPVVLSIAPQHKPAFKLQLKEKSQTHAGGPDYEQVIIQLGDPYLFAEDRLIATIAAFASKFKRQQAVRHHHAARSAATSSNDAAVGGMPDGLREGLEALLQLVCSARASDGCGTGTKGSLSASANVHVHLAD